MARRRRALVLRRGMSVRVLPIARVMGAMQVPGQGATGERQKENLNVDDSVFAVAENAWGQTRGNFMEDRRFRAFRVFLCIVFISSLYGGVALLTALMFAKGFLLLAVVSGLVLSVMTATSLALCGLAWSMTRQRAEPDEADLELQPI